MNMKRYYFVFLFLLMSLGIMSLARPAAAQTVRTEKTDIQKITNKVLSEEMLFLTRSIFIKPKEQVRVRLASKLKSLTLETSGPVYVYTPDKKMKFRVGPPLGLLVSLNKDGTLVCVDVPMGKHIVIDPQQGQTITFRGHVYNGVLHIFVMNGQISVVEYNDVETYLQGVVIPEMPPSAPLEALKAQAVAARSYVLGKKQLSTGKSFDVVNTPKDQYYVGVGSVTEKAIQAVKDTAGEVLFKDGKLLLAQYHAQCGGKTDEIPEGYCYFGSPAMKGVKCENCNKEDKKRKGHGIGLCQEGAMGKVRCENMKYKEILEYYYPGTVVKKLD